MPFEDLGLHPALLRALSDEGYSTPTPIQEQAIPLILAGHDLMAGAQTGTGKTAAFTLPVLQRLFPNGKRPLGAKRFRALVLTPTRELAAQVEESVRTYGRHIGVTTAAIFGGVGMAPQTQVLRRGVDVLVATPGRLIDHLQQGLELAHVEVLILDEADRMLDMGFLPALKRVVHYLPKSRQSLMFSATFADEIKELAAQFLRQPREVQVTPRNSVVTTVKHVVHPVDLTRKRELLLHLLEQDTRRQTLVFARTKHGSDRLVSHLERSGLKVAAIHGNKSQGARTKALADFKSGRINVLVATDIAARGLDIDQLPLVINHDLPMVAADYVHRIGRTGRNGAQGLAVSLVSQDEAGLLRDIQKVLKRDITIQAVAGYEPASPLKLTGPEGNLRPQQGNGNGRQGQQRRPQAQQPSASMSRSPASGRSAAPARGPSATRVASGGMEPRQALPARQGQARSPRK